MKVEVKKINARSRCRGVNLGYNMAARLGRSRLALACWRDWAAGSPKADDGTNTKDQRKIMVPMVGAAFPLMTVRI